MTYPGIGKDAGYICFLLAMFRGRFIERKRKENPGILITSAIGQRREKTSAACDYL